MKKDNRKWFTVIGVYRDNDQVWIEHVRAEGPQNAAVSALVKIADREEGSDPAVVDVIKGRHRGQLNTENVVILADGELQEL
jgi:pseudouridine-5'-phosphate glycosidase